MNALTPSLIVAIFSFGTAIFYALSCIEWSTLRLALNQHTQTVKNADVRFVHAALKRLIPLLPPSNGFVILFGTAALIYQCFLRGWDGPSILILTFYWLVTGYLITFGRIAAAVMDVRKTDSQGDIGDVRRGVSRLIVRHHIGLSANLGVVGLEFALVSGWL